jgi:5'-nucleotidase
VAEADGRVLTVYADGPADSAWVARVARWNANVEPIAAEVIGDAATALHRRRPESTIGDFICDAMRADVTADIAFQNPGGMRADLDAGPITKGDVYSVMPFDNTIVTMELSGAQVKLALEQSLRGDRVTQVSGVRYRYDPSRPALDRIVELTLADGSPLDPQKSYVVAVNNFMASGGDQYDALGQGKNRNDTGRLIRDAMYSHVAALKAKGQPLDVRTDGRITSTRGASD